MPKYSRIDCLGTVRAHQQTMNVVMQVVGSFCYFNFMDKHHLGLGDMCMLAKIDCGNYTLRYLLCTYLPALPLAKVSQVYKLPTQQDRRHCEAFCRVVSVQNA